MKRDLVLRLAATTYGACLCAATACTMELTSSMTGDDGGAPSGTNGVHDAAPAVDASASATPASPSADGAVGDATSSPLDDSGPGPAPTGTGTGNPPPPPANLPYSLPASGQAVLIGVNDADAIAPTGFAVSSWRYSLFGSYGGGCHVADYSSAGAYVIAATGGHNHPPNFGAAVFDFADAKWKRIDNANGMPWRTNDITRAETNGSPNWEIAIAGVTPGSIPAPTHTYMNVLPIPSAWGGGARGSVVLVMRGALATDPAGSHRSHRLDLATGTWSRLSTNVLSDVGDPYRYSVESPSVFEPVAKRYYQLPLQLQDVDHLPFLDGASWTWKAAPSFPYPPSSGSTYSAAFLDPARKLIVVHEDSGNLRAIDLQNMAGGAKNLVVSGALPAGAPNRWDYHPTTDAFYTYPGSGQKLYKLAPPGSSPLSGTWTVTTLTIGGATLAADVGNVEHGTRHYTRFFYVPALGVFAWIAGGANKVALVRP